MPYSILTYPGDGVTTTWPINFTLGFISRDDVKCRVGAEVDGLNQPVYRTLTWISDGLVEVQGTPAAIGQNVEFTRTIDKDELVHDYQDGAPITESNLDDSNKQLIMLLHEILDDRLRVLPASNWDMNAQRIVNLGAGIDPTDAVTVQQAAQAIALTPLAVQAKEDAEAAKIAAEEAAALAAQNATSTAMAPVCSAATLAAGRAAFGLGTAATTNATAFDTAGSAAAVLASSVQKSGETGAVALTGASSVTVPAPSAGDTSSKAAAMANFAQGANGSSVVLLSAQTISNAASVNFSVPVGYDEYFLVISGVTPVTGGLLLLQFSTDGGSTWIATNYSFGSWGYADTNATGYQYSGSAAYVPVHGIDVATTGGGGGVAGEVKLFGLSDSTIEARAICVTEIGTSTNKIGRTTGAQWFGATTIVNMIRLYFSSGNISSGRVCFYGIRRS